jgi:hypothetical protein
MDHESIYRSSPNEAFSCRLCDLFPGLFQKEDDAWDKQVSRFIGGSKLCFRARVNVREIKTTDSTNRCVRPGLDGILKHTLSLSLRFSGPDLETIPSRALARLRQQLCMPVSLTFLRQLEKRETAAIPGSANA